MKNNLKTKVMLAVLAGGMLCANGAWADWYGTTGNKWTTSSGSAEANNLTLTVDNDTTVGGNKVIHLTSFNTICGGYSGGAIAVTGNSITFNTSATTTIEAKIYGGYSGSGNATGNIVTIKGGEFNNAIYGGMGRGNVTGNKVIIEDGKFGGKWIFGGQPQMGSTNGAIKNEVTIKGGEFTNSDLIIRGGDGGIFGDATGNIVTIEGGTFVDGFKLYGGQPGSGKTSSGNILNLKTKITGTATEVNYFQEMNFTVTPNYIGGTMLSTKKMTFDATVINVDAVTGTRFAKDSVITLVNATEEMNDTFTKGTIPTGSELNLTDKKLTLTFTSDYIAPAKPEEKAVLEGVAASLAFVNQGADMVAGSGIDGLSVADSENPTIAAFSGNKTRYNTGSHVDIHGWNALAGVALNNKESFSHGVFVEIGNGDIDTYAALNGSGSSDYKGGGYMLRKDMGKGWTIDGAVRAGRVETSWGNDTKGGYEAKQTYYGAHVTFNKMLKEYGEQKLNGYLRYTFTHLGSDSVSLDGTHYGFDSVNSHRTRLGARMVEEGKNDFALYYGAAWEYGFGGDCDATVNGVTTSGPAVDGSNAVFEVGGTWSDKKWDISAGLEAYAGAKRGVAGGMNFVYKF